MNDTRLRRRDFLRIGALGLGQATSALAFSSEKKRTTGSQELRDKSTHTPDGVYRGAALSQIAFPMGGLGAGMICLGGTGALSKFSLHNRPDLASDPVVFAAISIKGPKSTARVLEGEVATCKLRPSFSEQRQGFAPAASLIWGLPRFHEAEFGARFPFGTVRFQDDQVPLESQVVGWSPFSPGDGDSASLPVAGLEYSFSNRGTSPIDAVFSFNAENFMATSKDPCGRSAKTSLDRIQPTEGGFILYGEGDDERPGNQGYCAIWVDDVSAKIDHAWFSGGLGVYFDSIRMLWNDISTGAWSTRQPLSDAPALGASIFVPFVLQPGQTKTIVVSIAWFVPKSNLAAPEFAAKRGQQHQPGLGPSSETYKAWYTSRFIDIADVKRYWQSNYSGLRQATEKFTRAFYDSTLPPEVVEAVAANLSILKSPTVLRQSDGRLWAWEGSYDSAGGGGYGSCTHVWNYAQALPHLFPNLERSLRDTEFGPDQGMDGFQAHRAFLPIRPIGDTEEGRKLPAAADGQLGGIIKAYRDWRISGDMGWLRDLWPRIRASLDFCIRTWDPHRDGWIREPHLTTYDVKLWGADSVCTSLYVGALKAATLMGSSLGDDIEDYAELLRKGVSKIETYLFNGEYFFQKNEWKTLREPFSPEGSLWFHSSPEGVALAEKEGPPYQYGSGCCSDGVLGDWLCLVSGIPDIFDRRKIESHLAAVYHYNLKTDLSDYAQVGRSLLGSGREGGLLLCTWPRGGKPSLPIIYADEVWTGVEYQVASHLVSVGKIKEGLEIVATVRHRYDGCVRNPFAETEAGQWYARAMSSYALLQAFSGARFDAVDRILYLKPAIQGDFRCFVSTATGYGTVGIKNGQPFLEVVSGQIPYSKFDYTPS